MVALDLVVCEQGDTDPLRETGTLAFSDIGNAILRVHSRGMGHSTSPLTWNEFAGIQHRGATQWFHL